MATTSVTLIGLGNMGVAIAQTLLKANQSLIIWNRTSTRPAIQELVTSGAKFEAGISDAISTSSTIIFCVLDYKTIRSILASTGTELMKGKTILNLTNGTPSQARDMATWFHDRNVDAYYDGGIMATPTLLGTPASMIFLSGSPAEQPEKSTIHTLISTLGRVEYLGSDPGAAAILDISLLTSMYGMFAGTLTAAALLKKSSIDLSSQTPPTTTISVESRMTTLINPLLGSLLPLNVALAAQVDKGEYPADGHPLTMQVVALRNIRETLEDQGIDAGVLGYFTSVAERLEETRGGEGGLFAVVELLIGR